MKLLQLIYTSCKRGLSPGAGFQTYSMSGGISDEERREVERFGLYVPPNNLPTQPTKVEIDTLFPVSLRFFQLQSGRYGICQSRYVGQDYSARYGNYLSHALILEKGCFPIYPIQMHGSSIFRSYLSEEELNPDTVPPLLPLLDLDQVTASHTIGFDDVAEFASNNIDMVKLLVSAAISHAQTRRKLVLCGPQPDIHLWIAALQMAFTIKLAHQLTFTTYSHDPSTINTMIYAIPKTGSRFAFSETQRNFDYYIFDLENPGNNKNIIDNEYAYTKNVDLGYTISHDILADFHRFIDLFDYHTVDHQLETLNDLYRFLKVEDEILPADRILKAVEFADTYAPTSALSQVSDHFAQILEPVSRHVDFESAEITTKFLFKIARKTEDMKHLNTAYSFFFHALDHLIMENPRVSVEAVQNFYAGVREFNHEYDDEFTQRVLSNVRFDQMIRSITDTRDPICAEIYFNLAVDTFLSLHYTWNSVMKSHRLFKPFLESVFAILVSSEINLRGALAEASQNAIFFVGLIVFWVTRCETHEQNQEELLKSYIFILQGNPPGYVTNVRLKLIENGREQFVYQEYLQLLKKSDNKIEFFHHYFDSIFSESPQFLKNYFDPAVEDYLELLADKERYAACSRLIYLSEYIGNSKIMKKIILGFEEGLPLSAPGGEISKMISLSAKIKKQHKISTIPDITALLQVAIYFENQAGRRKRKPIIISDYVTPPALSLKPLEAERAAAYFKWCIPHMIRFVNSKEDHETLFLWSWNSRLDRAFVSFYIDAIMKFAKEDRKTGIDILAQFLKFYLSTLFKNKQFEGVRDKIHTTLVKSLAHLSKSQADEVRLRTIHSKEADEKDARKELLDLLGRGDEQRKSLLERVTEGIEKIMKNFP